MNYGVLDYTPRESQCINLSALPDDFITLILQQGYFFGVFWATEDSGLSETLSFWTN